MVSKLNESAVAQALGELPGWSLQAGKLHWERTFRDFVEAFGFMTRVALLAERANHHPEWSNVYNRLSVDLTTHDCGGLSALDLRMARAIDAWAQEAQPAG